MELAGQRLAPSRSGKLIAVRRRRRRLRRKLAPLTAPPTVSLYSARSPSRRRPASDKSRPPQANSARRP